MTENDTRNAAAQDIMAIAMTLSSFGALGLDDTSITEIKNLSARLTLCADPARFRIDHLFDFRLPGDDDGPCLSDDTGLIDHIDGFARLTTVAMPTTEQGWGCLHAIVDSGRAIVRFDIVIGQNDAFACNAMMNIEWGAYCTPEQRQQWVERAARRAASRLKFHTDAVCESLAVVSGLTRPAPAKAG